MPIAIICGGRDLPPFTPAQLAWLNHCAREQSVTEILEGGAQKWDRERRCWLGADYHARVWAQAQGIYVVTFWANWTKLGKRAGPERNIRMRDELVRRRENAGAKVMVLAFPGGSGTAHMIAAAVARDIPVFTFEGV